MPFELPLSLSLSFMDMILNVKPREGVVKAFRIQNMNVTVYGTFGAVVRLVAVKRGYRTPTSASSPSPLEDTEPDERPQSRLETHTSLKTLYVCVTKYNFFYIVFEGIKRRAPSKKHHRHVARRRKNGCR